MRANSNEAVPANEERYVNSHVSSESSWSESARSSTVSDVRSRASNVEASSYWYPVEEYGSRRSARNDSDDAVSSYEANVSDEAVSDRNSAASSSAYEDTASVSSAEASAWMVSHVHASKSSVDAEVMS